MVSASRAWTRRDHACIDGTDQHSWTAALIHRCLCGLRSVVLAADADCEEVVVTRGYERVGAVSGRGQAAIARARRAARLRRVGGNVPSYAASFSVTMGKCLRSWW